MIKTVDKNELRKQRHLRVRKKVEGTGSIPRLCVYRSNANIYAQIIDDESQKTLVSASTMDKELKGSLTGKDKKEQAKEVGKLLAQRAKKSSICQVVFDRGGYLYTGRVASLAEGAREGGLEF